MTNKAMIVELRRRGTLTGGRNEPLMPGEVQMGGGHPYIPEWTLEAPAGHRWRSEEIHEYVATAGTDKELLTELMLRSEGGSEPCPDPQCEWCHPELDD